MAAAMGQPSLQQDPSPTLSFTYSDVAKKLIKVKLLLTALELHTELIESGREVKHLKDFFSNPGNFELQTQEYSSKICKFRCLQ